MNWKITICILTGILVFSQVGTCQTNPAQNSLKKLDKLFPVAEKARKNSYPINFDNEIQLLITGSFSFYKNFISTQDALHCTFYPSCSAYALETIQLNGILGLFDAIDRLTRCNGFSPEKYDEYAHSHLFYDPVKKIQ